MLISKFSTDAAAENIAAMEQQYNIELPEQYKCFLLKYNGGYTPKTNFKAGKISSDLRCFYGTGNVERSLDDANIELWFEKGIIPIACDSFGNHIAIGLKENNAGKIFFCDHEKGNKAECIAETFADFLKYCSSEKISAASKRSIKEREELLTARGRGHIITDALREMWQAEIDKYGNMTQEKVVIE